MPGSPFERDDQQPRVSERELEKLSGIAELLRPFSLASSRSIAAGTESWLVRSSLQKGREGLLLDWAASWPADWNTSPVYVATLALGAKDATTARNNGDVRDKVLGPYETPVGSMGSPISLRPWGLFFREGNDVGIVIKNGEAVAQTGAAYLFGVTWSERHARRVREVLLAQGFLVPPWGAGAVFGEG